jgi:hypothetical protein
MKLNGWGNAYPEGQPIFTVVTIKDGRRFKKGQVFKVMESLNPNFKGKWRINDSEFINKDCVRLIL